MSGEPTHPEPERPGIHPHGDEPTDPRPSHGRPPYGPADGAPPYGAPYATHGTPFGTPPGAAFGPPVQAPRRPRGIRRAVALGAAALALAVGAGAGGAVGAIALTDEPARSSPTAVSGVSASNGSVSAVASAVLPSVVSITAQSGTSSSGGSGVILSEDGTILTNAHVVEGARQVAVKFSEGSSAQATVVGSDRTNDIAVLKAQGVSGLKPATFGPRRASPSATRCSPSAARSAWTAR